MLGGGSSVLTDVDEYEAALPGRVGLLPTTPGAFRARLSWVELPHMCLLSAHEAAPRIARISLPADRLAVLFPAHPNATLTCDGISARPGDVIVHSPGERFHQCTPASCKWGAICLSPESLSEYGRILVEQDIRPPPVGQVLHVKPSDRKRLLRLHAEAARIARSDPASLRHPEVTRALDQDLIFALVTCIANSRPRVGPANYRKDAAILRELDDALIAGAGRLLKVSDASRVTGVSERTLRDRCSQILGIGAQRYIVLDRLRQARRAVLRASPGQDAIARIISRYGFAGPGEFAAAYRQAFGDVSWPTSLKNEFGLEPSLSA